MISSPNKETKVSTVFYSNAFKKIKTPTRVLLSDAIEIFFLLLFCNFFINNLIYISNYIIVFSVLYSFLHNCILYNLIQIKSNLNQLNANKTGSYIIRYDSKMYVNKCVLNWEKERTLSCRQKSYNTVHIFNKVIKCPE